MNTVTNSGLYYKDFPIKMRLTAVKIPYWTEKCGYIESCVSKRSNIIRFHMKDVAIALKPLSKRQGWLYDGKTGWYNDVGLYSPELVAFTSSHGEDIVCIVHSHLGKLLGMVII